MLELVTLGGAGFLLGFRHAFEPDHLAAVSTLATRQGGWRDALRLGLAWGLGHTLTVGLAVLLLALLDLRLPPLLNRGAELAVAALLLLLGVSALWALRHRPDPQRPLPLGQSHPHRPEERGQGARRDARQSFGFGLAHGLAGSGSIVVLLAATATTQAQRVAYFLPFGLGTVGGMLLVSLVVSRLSRSAASHDPRWALGVRLTAALVSVAVGLWLGWTTLAELGRPG
ncbi:MAG: sulfite exporter TauE/SafE family protein [Thermoanaerobaculia bacterium]